MSKRSVRSSTLRQRDVSDMRQVTSLPAYYPTLNDEDRGDKKIALDKVDVLVSHNFFEQSKGRLMERIHRFLKNHPKVTPEARSALKQAELDTYIKVRQLQGNDRWYVYRGG